jgi:two-component system, NarL family, response regulator NreC
LAGGNYVATRRVPPKLRSKTTEPGVPRKFEALSAHERSVLRRVAEGYSDVQIARLLSITPRTVDAYKTRIAQKLGFTHRTDYLRVALQLGLVGDANRLGTITTGSR